MNNKLKSTERTLTWLQKRNSSEKRLIVISAVLGLLTLSAFIALGIVVSENSGFGDTCMTPGCINAAAEVLSYMDNTIDPCDDFHQFACGSFLKNTIIPQDEVSISTSSYSSDQVEEQLMDILNHLESNATKPYRLMKRFYDLCMNTTAIEEDGLTTFNKLLNDLGGWPLLEGASWSESDFNWKETVYNARKLGLVHKHFISIYIDSNFRNSSSRSIYIGEGHLGLSREYLIQGMENKHVNAYYDYMVDVAVIFGANRADAIEEVKDILEFEIELAKIKLPKEESRNATLFDNPMSINELQNNYPFINWLEYIQNMLDIPGIEIDYDEVVIVTVPQYLFKVEVLLRQTPIRVLSNFIMTRTTLTSIPLLTEILRKRQTEFRKIFTGKSEREPRWKECINIITENFYIALSALYTKKHFQVQVKRHAEEMVNDILSQFKHMLTEVDWMDETTRRNALEKANAITSFIGYPDELLDEEKIEKFYAMVNEPSDNYFLALSEYSLFMADVYNKKLRKPVNKTSWEDHSYSFIVDAFYDTDENSIEFPAAILQGVFYSDDRPRYMNYGGIGYVIGHEITHGFDDEGRQYDKDGNLNNWWGEETKEAFLKKTECIIHQYGNYTVPEIDKNLNGVNTQGENVADNGGIKEAYIAYTNWVKRNGPEQKLPGLSYTPNQMFWISAAQTWCSKIRIESLDQQVTLGYHSPDKYRVLGPFSNSDHFSKDFNCPVGSVMNPVNKSHLTKTSDLGPNCPHRMQGSGPEQGGIHPNQNRSKQTRFGMDSVMH